jgi:signal transduction histidine kinase
MIGEADRLNRSIQQLLSFSRPVPDEWQEINLTELLEDTARLLARQYAGELIRIEHRIEPGMRLKRGNPELVKQIVLNLVLNAVQVSQPGQKVRVTAEGRPPVSMVIAVSDHGPGIPASMREKIFEPFFTTKQRGTGLGLAIVRKNVQHFGGEIRVESPSEGGRGTRIEVTLPVE